MRRLLERHWSPAGVTLPKQPLSEETSAAIIRITGGNFRLLPDNTSILRKAASAAFRKKNDYLLSSANASSKGAGEMWLR
jgi:hypothetical protein